ncbi:MAG: haloacid dehalogenase [Verrucomicrobiales bacterium VVV1]|nr:MAG: haloacid dehalogenase [Verrucomicrobiales bacterium VVV1]
MNPPRTILLDAAGTLIEPSEPVATVYARHFAMAGHDVEESVIRQAFGQVFRLLPPPDYPADGDGDAAERLWWRSVVRETASRCELPSEVAESGALFDSLFHHYESGAAWRVFPEVESVLKELAANGSSLAVVSNFDNRLHRILDDLDLTRWFAAVITSADAASRKPDGVIFLHALNKLARSPSEVVHIGDSAEADQAGAENVGIRAFLLDRPRVTLCNALEWIRSGGERK